MSLFGKIGIWHCSNMKLKIITISAVILVFISCQKSTKDQIKDIYKYNHEPNYDKINKFNLGETIVFSSSGTQGIDQSLYPEHYYYEKEIDTLFFKFIKTESVFDQSDGGYTSKFNIYKIIKSGKTEIKVFQNESIRYLYQYGSKDSLTGQTIVTKPKKEFLYSYLFEILE